MRPIPIPINLVSMGCLVLEATDADRLGPTDLHQQTVFDVEVGWGDGVWGGGEDECRPLAHFPLSSTHPRFHLIERRVHHLGVRWVIVHVEQREPRVVVTQVAYDVAWPIQYPFRGSPLWNKESLSGSVIDHRLRHAMSQVDNRLKLQAVVPVQAMDELCRPLRKRPTGRNLLERRVRGWTYYQRSPPEFSRNLASKRGVAQRPRLLSRQRRASTPALIDGPAIEFADVGHGLVTHTRTGVSVRSRKSRANWPNRAIPPSATADDLES